MAANDIRKQSVNRCINIDWLEVHVLESNELYPVDASYFVRHGYGVQRREYGTRVYDEMFTILDKHEEPFIEVRRAPKSAKDEAGILDPRSAHIRLVNRWCYSKDAVSLLRDFLQTHGYEFRRIFRLDICYDFERFDGGDDPQNFVRRYIRHRYTKINQCNRRVIGDDRWEGCVDNSVSWGAKKSMVSTKLYNKTLELKQENMKPYIVQAWMACNLITNPLTMTKIDCRGREYTPTIWRVEFSIKSGNAGWAVLEDCTGHKNKTISIEHKLTTYDTDQKLLTMFASLAHHYFHFKKFERGKRKDLCEDKVLFKFDLNNDQLFRLQRVSQAEPRKNEDARLYVHLQRYAEQHIDPDIRKACNVLLKQLDKEHLGMLATSKWDYRQVEELQMLLERRLSMPEESFQNCLDAVRRLLQRAADETLF